MPRCFALPCELSAKTVGGLAWNAGGDHTAELSDEVGLSRHPKAAQLLKGLGTLRLTAKAKKVSGMGSKECRLKERIIVLTDSYLCDCDEGSYKVKHKVNITDRSALQSLIASR